MKYFKYLASVAVVILVSMTFLSFTTVKEKKALGDVSIENSIASGVWVGGAVTAWGAKQTFVSGPLWSVKKVSTGEYVVETLDGKEIRLATATANKENRLITVEIKQGKAYFKAIDILDKNKVDTQFGFMMYVE